MAGLPDPKPERRRKASREEWAEVLAPAVYEACGWRCIACGEENLAMLSIHHVVPKDRGGDDVLENLVVLCGYKPLKPTGCHKTVQEHLDGWEKVAARVRAFVWARASRLLYARDKLGEDGFDRMYPLPTALAIGDLHRARTPDPELRGANDG